MDFRGKDSEQPPAQAPKPFQSIYRLDKSSPGVHVLLISDIGTGVQPTWGICHGHWLEAFEKQDQSILFQSYDHGISSSNLSSWDTIIEEGHTLLTSIHQYHQQHNPETPEPLIFMAHGFGGFILKQALSIASMHIGKYLDLLSVIAGIVFLGTPHHLDDATDEQYGERIACLLKANIGTSLQRQTFTRLKRNSFVLRDISVRFSKISLQVPTLSVFETKASKLRDSGIFQKSKSLIVVDQSLSRIGSRLEEQLGLDLDHVELPRLIEATHHRPSYQMETWLLAAISRSVSDMKGRFRHSRTNSEHSIDSLVRIEDIRKALSGGASSSRVAQYGSTSTSSIVDVETFLETSTIQHIDPRVPCFMVETFVRNLDFFGRRNVLSRLDECLLPSKDLLVASQPDRARVGVLSGMAGLGKTETAIEYAYSRQQEFDCIFWLRAEDTGKLETDLAQIAVRLGIHDPTDPKNKTINKGLALGWLTNPFKIELCASSPQRTPATWLIIFDNADDLDVLSPYKDIANCGAVLITSRDPLSKSAYSPSARDIELNPFDYIDAGRLLQQIAHVSDHDDEARQIGAKLGGLPIGIAQMGSLIRWKCLSFAEFLGIYESRLDETEVIESNAHSLRETARGTVSTIWAIEKMSEEARYLLEIIAFLNPDRIQSSLLSAKTADLSTSSRYPLKRGLTFYDARKELIRSSLIRRNDKEEFWVHRLVQHAVRTKMSPERRIEIFSRAVSSVASEWTAPPSAHEPVYWDEMEALHPHVVSLKDNYVKYLSDQSVDNRDILARLLQRAAWYQIERGVFNSPRPMLLLALEICEQSDRNDPRILDLESDVYASLGAVAGETNDADSCLKYNKRHLEIQLNAQKQSETPIEKLPRAYNQIGLAWMMARDYEKAEWSFSSSITGLKALPKLDINILSIFVANIGLTYWLQGRLGDAAAVLEEGLRDREEVYGFMDTHSFRTGRLLHALGNVYFSQGLVEKSEQFHCRALTQYQSTIGHHHHRTADVCHRVAQHCLRNGRHEQALRLLDQALKVWSADESSYRPEIARTTFLKAKVVMALDREMEAAALYHKALASRKRLTIQPQKHEQLGEADFDELVTFWSR